MAEAKSDLEHAGFKLGSNWGAMVDLGAEISP